MYSTSGLDELFQILNSVKGFKLNNYKGATQQYYLCPQKCDHLVCDEIMIVSKDLKHDSLAADTFVDKALSHLKEKGILVKRIIMWSDNCGTQY